MRIAMWAALAAVGFSVGCGGSDASKPTASSTAPAAATAAQIPSDPVGRVVYDFLESVRIGKGSEGAEKLLTPLALKGIDEHEMCIAPPGSSTARFTINHVEMMEDGEHAIVYSTWTDLDADGVAYNDSIYWALRLADGEWRIHGMAPEPAEGEDFVKIDFEHLEEYMEPQQASPVGVPADQLAAPAGQAAPAGEQPAASVASDPFNQTAPR
ncbi:hypothetical protein [Lacipirellula sp.]|uniref:hypothetical protein n=1 Tax=Lacipirellula sp. TaxID=2691419 RepID=UPI003D13A7F8